MSGEGLRTARLELSVPTAGDAAEILAVVGDPRAVAHNPSDLVADPERAGRLVAEWIRRWSEQGVGYWCVRELGHSRIVGYCGTRAMTVHGQPVWNLIYRFAPDTWGRGYATEAAAAAVAWVSAQRPGETIIARVRPANLASQAVALKVGLERDPALDVRGEDGPDLAFTNRRGLSVADEGAGRA